MDWHYGVGMMGFALSVLAQQVIDRSQLFKESPYERYTTYRVSFTGGLGLPGNFLVVIWRKLRLEIIIWR